jgi:hypothetical protein
MTRVRRGDDRGVAALEMGILTSVLLLLAFGALPLYSMLRASQSVSKSSAATLRYATSVASNARRNADGSLSRRPTFDEIQRFARDAAGDSSLAVTVTVCKGAACTDIDDTSPDRARPIPAAAGDEVTLRVSRTVDLSVIGRIANAAANVTGGDDVFPENDTTVASTASAREE